MKLVTGMRRTLVLLAFIGFVGTGTAVVGGPNESKGEMVLMDSGSSSSATTSVGPNGTKWNSEISNLNSTCRGPEDLQRLEFIGFQTDGNLTELNFKGRVNTSNPCTELSLDVNQTGENSYRIEIVEESSEGICTQCLGNSEFKGSFATEGDYNIEIVHEGQILGTQKTPGYSEGKETEPKDASLWKGFNGIIEWFRSLF